MPNLNELKIKSCENLTNPYNDKNAILIESSNLSDKNYSYVENKKFLNYIYLKNFLDYYKKNINTKLDIEFENNIISYRDDGFCSDDPKKTHKLTFK